MDLNKKYLVTKQYQKLTVRIQLSLLDFYPLMTKEQFQQLKAQAFARNLKTKYAPLILSHSAIFNMRRNNPTDALSQIERAIKIT